MNLKSQLSPQLIEPLFYPTKLVEIELGGRNWKIEVLADMEATIDQLFALAEKSGKQELLSTHAPYFGQLWSSGLALAGYITQNIGEFLGKNVLEIGCGLSLPSFVLVSKGIKVLAVDSHPDVAVFLKANAKRNQQPMPELLLGDWKTVTYGRRFDTIIAADILYEAQQVQSLFDFYRTNKGPKTELFLADPGRNYLSVFASLVKSEGWSLKEEVIDDVFLLRVSP